MNYTLKKLFNPSTILGFIMFLITVGVYVFSKPDNISPDMEFVINLIYYSFITIVNLLFGIAFFITNILRD